MLLLEKKKTDTTKLISGQASDVVINANRAHTVEYEV